MMLDAPIPPHMRLRRRKPTQPLRSTSQGLGFALVGMLGIIYVYLSAHEAHHSQPLSARQPLHDRNPSRAAVCDAARSYITPSTTEPTEPRADPGNGNGTDPAPCLIIHHIPKTAGLNLVDYFLHNMPGVRLWHNYEKLPPNLNSPAGLSAAAQGPSPWRTLFKERVRMPYAYIEKDIYVYRCKFMLLCRGRYICVRVY